MIIGGAAGAAIDAAHGDDVITDGAVIGALVAKALTIAVPITILAGAGFYGWRVLRSAIDREAGVAA